MAGLGNGERVVNEITARDFGRLEAKVDQLLEYHRDTRRDHDELEGRVRDVETTQAGDRRVNTIFGAIAGSLMGVLFAWLSRHIPPIGGA